MNVNSNNAPIHKASLITKCFSLFGIEDFDLPAQICWPQPHPTPFDSTLTESQTLWPSVRTIDFINPFSLQILAARFQHQEKSLKPDECYTVTALSLGMTWSTNTSWMLGFPHTFGCVPEVLISAREGRKHQFLCHTDVLFLQIFVTHTETRKEKNPLAAILFHNKFF